MHAIFFAALALLALCYYSCIKPKNYPPGPQWYPFIGCLLIFQKLRNKMCYMHLAFEELSKIYGPLLGLKFGKQLIVVVSTDELVKKVLLRDEFNGRPDGFFFRVRAFGKEKGILFVDDPVWTHNRRFTMRHLKALGFGQKAASQARLANEAKLLVSGLRERCKLGPVPMHNVFDFAVINSLWIMMAGHRFDYGDPKLLEILHVVHEIFKKCDAMGGILSHMPWVRYVMPELSGYNDLMHALRLLWGFIGSEIEEHETNLAEKDDRQKQPRDLIEAFLMEIKDRDSKTLNEHEVDIFDRENLLILCLDMFLAGLKTTSDTLSTLFLFLTLNPGWIKKLQDELDAVVGRNRSPTLDDMDSCPTIEAFLSEALRSLTLSPLAVPHKTTKDTQLEGYFIPKDTIVILNFYSVHNDKKFWKQPEVFNPERFLDGEGKFRQISGAIPFGIGKRRCLGEPQARSSLFLLFTHVLHHFEFSLPPGDETPDINGHDGFSISPKSYRLILKPRADTMTVID